MADTKSAGALLVVDDTEANREVLARRLGRRGFQVTEAANGKQALAAVASGSFDLVLLDIMMPDISGLEVLEVIRKDYTFAQLPVIMATAKGEEAVPALELGANDFVTKPINFPTLLARVTNHVQLVRYDRELRDAKIVAEQASRAKSSFLANMSHEVRTPLNAVIGFANVLLKNKQDNLTEKQLTYLSRIADNGTHLLKLINDILDLSKVEASKLELVVEDVDVVALVRDTVEQLEGRPRSPGVELRAELCAESVVVRGDSHRMRQVLINLISNAIKFTSEGSITVAITPERIDVVDTGTGIPADRLTAIFETFEQADSTIGRRYGGTGLGLAISRSLCAKMGFELTVESRENSGSTFSIVMPHTKVS
jgi:signal transduction histidine kinase